MTASNGASMSRDRRRIGEHCGVGGQRTVRPDGEDMARLGMRQPRQRDRAAVVERGLSEGGIDDLAAIGRRQRASTKREAGSARVVRFGEFERLTTAPAAGKVSTSEYILARRCIRRSRRVDRRALRAKNRRHRPDCGDAEIGDCRESGGCRRGERRNGNDGRESSEPQNAYATKTHDAQREYPSHLAIAVARMQQATAAVFTTPLNPS